MSIDVELLLTFEGLLNLLVQLVVGCAIWSVALGVVRVPCDDVVSNSQVVHEVVQLDHVHSVAGDVDVTTVLVVFGCHEHFNGSLDVFFRFHRDLVGEGLVVHPVLLGAYVEAVLLQFFLGVVYGVANIGIERVAVGFQIVDVDFGDFHSWEFQVVFGVRVHVHLVSVELAHHLLVVLVEHWVAHASLEVFQSGWS